jgi:hypothetical protein
MLGKLKNYFSPLPNRAWLDDRLQRMHYRVLGVIAMHDRFGQNGLGCTLSTRRIAEFLSSTQPNVSTACRDLIEWGYIRISPNPSHAQKQMRCIVYDVADRDVLKPRTDMQEKIGPASNRYVGKDTKETPLKEAKKFRRRSGARNGILESDHVALS